MSEPKTKASQAKRRWTLTRIVLIASLAVNLLIASVFLGAYFKHEKPSGRHLSRVSMGIGANIAALPDPERAEIAALIGKGSDNRRKFRKAMRDSQKALEKALLAVPFSEAEVRAAFEQHRRSALRNPLAVQEAYVDAIVAMTDEERAAHFARAQEIRKERRDKKWKKKARD